MTSRPAPRSRRPPGLALLLGLLLLQGACLVPEEEPGRPRAVPPGYTGEFSVWWNDAQVREQGTYLDGQRHGRVRTFFPDGTLATDGHYLAGQADGTVSQWSEAGVLRLEQSFSEGKPDGPRREFHADGSPALRQEWVDGLQVGLEERWHPTGSLASRGRWKAGLPHGRWEHFDAAGRPLTRQWYWVAGGVLVGTLESRLDPLSGRVLAQSLETLRDQGSAGWTTFWHPNGQQSGLIEVRDGRRHGRDLAWDEQGQLVSEGRWEADHKVGLWRSFDPSGALVEELDHGEAPPATIDDPHAGR